MPASIDLARGHVADTLGRARRLRSRTGAPAGVLGAPAASPTLKQEFVTGAVVFEGFDEELHDRVSGVPGGFKAACDQLRAHVAAGEKPVVKIAVRKKNFFCLERIARRAMGAAGVWTDVRHLAFNPFPVARILRNFLEYVEDLRAAFDPSRVVFSLEDADLPEALALLESRAAENPGRARELLRLFSIVAEHAFIGPQTIVIDPYHRCNTNCLHCWVHTPSVKHEEEFLNRRMDLDKFKEIMDDAAELMVDGIILQGDGDPLLSPDFKEFVRYPRSLGINVSFFTNAILLNEDMARFVIDEGVSQIFCSLPAGNGPGYHKVCPMHTEKTFHLIVENMRRLCEMKRRAGRGPHVIMTHVINNLSYRDLADFAKTDVHIAADTTRFYMIRLDSMNTFLMLEPDEVQWMRDNWDAPRKTLEEAGIEVWDNFQFQLDNYDDRTGAWSKDVFLGLGCTIGYFFNLIPAKLDASLCCHLRTVGHLDRERYRDMWRSDRYRAWRAQAKHMKENAGVRFLNGQALYDDHCDHCDNHQTLLYNADHLQRLGFDKFL